MDLFGKRVTSAKECITPHKISLLVLISELCDRNELRFTPFKEYRYAMMLLLLNLIQARLFVQCYGIN